MRLEHYYAIVAAIAIFSANYPHMRITKTLILLLYSSLISFAALAQSEDADTAATEDDHKGGGSIGITMGDGREGEAPTGHWYLSNSFDGAIFSTAVFEKPGHRRGLSMLRFSLLNIGYNFNYDFDDRFGIFTGIGIKNIGFIEKNGDSTIKRRVYTIGAPLGFKLGNLRKKNYGFIGGGVDFPLNYREKGFVKRGDKQKFNEWFSDRVPDYMPYLFVGFAYNGGSTLKVQYYPSNFMNTEYTEVHDGIYTKPYNGYRVNLLYITLGIDIHYKRHEHHKKEEADPAPAEM